jgi:hypothetical protein
MIVGLRSSPQVVAVGGTPDIGDANEYHAQEEQS